VRVNFDETKSVVVLSAGLYGRAIFGEHLEESEKEQLSMIREEFSNKAVKISSKDISPILRTLLEEGGFHLASSKIDCFYVHFDNRPARDPRYTIYNNKDDDKDEVFGYMRESSSDTVVALIEGSAPDVIGDPLDSIECDKPIIMNTKDVLRLVMSDDDRFSLAFWCHAYQIAVALNSDVLLKEDERLKQISFLGKTVSELKEQYKDGNIVVAMMEGWALKVGRKYDKRRLNVSVAANGKIDRILCYY